MFVPIKIKLIERASEKMESVFKNFVHRSDTDHFKYCLSSCNFSMMMKLRKMTNNFSRISGEYAVDIFDSIEMLMNSISTNADRMYFSQYLIFRRKLEQSISLLEAIVEQEGDFSTSVVIWSKNLYECCLINDNLRQELIKSSADYVVFPANLYARYLLSIACSSLSQEENRINNQAELIILRERYSRIPEFAPMLKIMSAVS